MPAVEPQIAVLIVAPDAAMQAELRCPFAQCKVTDYKTAACVGHLGNSLSHLLLALSTLLQEVQALQEAQVDGSVREVWNVSLQAFVYQTRELGRLFVQDYP